MLWENNQLWEGHSDVASPHLPVVDYFPLTEWQCFIPTQLLLDQIYHLLFCSVFQWHRRGSRVLSGGSLPEPEEIVHHDTWLPRTLPQTGHRYSFSAQSRAGMKFKSHEP